MGCCTNRKKSSPSSKCFWSLSFLCINLLPFTYRIARSGFASNWTIDTRSVCIWIAPPFSDTIRRIRRENGITGEKRTMSEVRKWMPDDRQPKLIFFPELCELANWFTTTKRMQRMFSTIVVYRCCQDELEKYNLLQIQPFTIWPMTTRRQMQTPKIALHRRWCGNGTHGVNARNCIRTVSPAKKRKNELVNHRTNYEFEATTAASSTTTTRVPFLGECFTQCTHNARYCRCACGRASGNVFVFRMGTMDAVIVPYVRP